MHWLILALSLAYLSLMIADYTWQKIISWSFIGFTLFLIMVTGVYKYVL